MSAWIFQGNPKRFDIDRYLLQQFRSTRELGWTVPKSAQDQISVGDQAFMWRADGRVPQSGGLIAVGSVIASPSYLPGTVPSLWTEDEPAAKDIALRVGIRLDELRPTPQQGMVLRVDLENDPVLRSLRILHFRAVTISPVSVSEASELLRRWERRRPANVLQ